MTKIKNTVKAIILFILMINLSCSNDELNEKEHEKNIATEEIDLEKINAKIKLFLLENSNKILDLETDEKLNEIINEELINYQTTNISKDKTSSTISSRKNSNVAIHRFYKNGDHFYTKSYSEGVNAGFAYEGVLGFASYGYKQSNFITRWYGANNGDRVLSVSDVNKNNHYPIAKDIYDRIGNYNFRNGTYGGVTIVYDFKLRPLATGKWIVEGILGGTGGNRAIYSYYNHNLKDHLYTNNFKELGNGANGYVYNGIAFYLN